MSICYLFWAQEDSSKLSFPEFSHENKQAYSLAHVFIFIKWIIFLLVAFHHNIHHFQEHS